MIIGTISIPLAGSVKLNRTTRKVSKKPSTVDFYDRNSKGKVYKVGTLAYAGYEGLSHDVELQTTQAVQTLPIRQEMWDYWMSNPPSFYELGKLGKGKKSQIKKFMQLTDYAKALAHCRDIAFDVSGDDEVKIELT